MFFGDLKWLCIAPSVARRMMITRRRVRTARRRCRRLVAINRFNRRRLTAGVPDWKQQGADKKIVAGLLGVLAGGFGIHKFILGYTTEGIIQIVITFVTCGMGSIIGLIEGIIYLTKSDEDFVRTYIQNKKGWF